jgi:predicted anti-sigma-YlaC factor YlaD
MRLYGTLLLLAGALLSGCSVKKFAINKVGDSVAKSGATYASDDDPDLVGQAVPFGLKLMEGLLAESPKHRGLLFAASSGFTEYAYAYVQEPSEELESEDLARANFLKARARRLYLRARDYGIRGLETRHPGFGASLREDSKKAVRSTTRRDVPLLYWTAVSWGAAIALSKDRPDLVAEQPLVETLIDRAYELDPDFAHGAIDQFLITYEPARQGANGDFASRSKQHFDRAVALTSGQSASPFVAYAESVSAQKQNRGEFEVLLQKALAVDPDARPEWRLSNLIEQRRARWLLSREDELFVE